MLILGIESSCDDTSVALLEANEQGFKILAEKTASQIEVHKKYGGVVPEIAGRCHAENIMPLVEEVMGTCLPVGRAGSTAKPDVIAVTSGPGLITGLLVGIEAAKNLSYLWDVPLIGTNHIEGHVHSVEILNSKITFPALCLIVSGGHTELILMRDHGDYEIIGSTVDDAAGECFDKVAKLLGFDYPGGPKISKFAAEGNPQAINFPRPMLNDKGSYSAKGGPAFGWNFSFAGLKTSALYWLRDNSLTAVPVNPLNNLPAGIFGQSKEEVTINDFCASFEQAIIDVLVTKTIRAAKKFQPKTIVLGGGVSANKKLREALKSAIQSTTPDTQFLIPDLKYAMDNAAMIAVAGYYRALKNEFTICRELSADPNWKIDG